jgi:hypothetical protein
MCLCQVISTETSVKSTFIDKDSTFHYFNDVNLWQTASIIEVFWITLYTGTPHIFRLPTPLLLSLVKHGNEVPEPFETWLLYLEMVLSTVKHEVANTRTSLIYSFPQDKYFVTPVIDCPISRSHSFDPILRWVELVWVEGFHFLDVVYDGNLKNWKLNGSVIFQLHQGITKLFRVNHMENWIYVLISRRVIVPRNL